MNYLITGLNHSSAPVDIREQVAVSDDALPSALHELTLEPGVEEAMIVSTCNRVELIVSYDARRPNLAEFFAKRAPSCAAELPAHLYHHHDSEAVRHLFRVAASLDSMVVGEPQILGQVKDAYSVARASGTALSQLEKLLRSTFATAKRIRSETKIGENSASIASVSVDLASKIFGSLSGTRVLLVGAGKMAELAARHLMAKGAGSLTIANRTVDRSRALANTFASQHLPFERLASEAHHFDILITSTGSPQFLLSREQMISIMGARKNHPMFVIDIAVPRDVDPESGRIEGVFLYDVDDLQSFAASNLAERTREIAEAESIVGVELEKFTRNASGLDAAAPIRELQRAVEAIRLAELQKSAKKLATLTPEQRDVIEMMTRAMANKFLHRPMKALRDAAIVRDRKRLETITDAFCLEAPLEDKTYATQNDEIAIAFSHSSCG